MAQDKDTKPKASKYQLRGRMTLAATHKRHQPPVHGCLLCEREGKV